MKHKILIGEGIKKYFLYAIGEVFLIVIGILMALQINIWKELRKERLLERSYTSRILNDIKQDQKNLENILSFQADKLKKNINFQDEIEKITTVNQEELDSLFIIILDKNLTFYPVIGSYQSTLSVGGIRIFKNKDFISKIITLYDSQYKRLVYNGEVLDDKFFKLTEKYKHERRIHSMGAINEIHLTKILDDFYWYQRQQDYYVKKCQETLVFINDILNVENSNTVNDFAHDTLTHN